MILATIDITQTIDEYIKKTDWRVDENSNAHYCFGALNKYITSKTSAQYWLENVYNQEIKDAHNNGFFHIHDLGGLTLYCCGYSLKDIIQKGICGISNIPSSASPRHFMSLLNQIANIITIYQNEIMGAVAFSSFDTLCAPFVKVDNLSYEEVYQHMQNFIFSINSNSRGGAEPAFSNLTFDLTPSKDLLYEKVIVGNKELDFTYKDCQKEMDMINKAFFEIMIKGDRFGNPFPYPIPTYNIHERFDWDNPNNELLWEMTGKYGTPYFANFINSDMQPEDARSMCCRLRLDKRELLKRNGGLFGSGEKTGSIGVVTLNLPRFGYLAKDKDDLFMYIKKYMQLASDSLEIKRKFIQKEVLDRGLIPAFKEYVGTLNNHFSTIGLIGMNEMVENLYGYGIDTIEGKELCLEVLDFMREKCADFQEKTGNLYNLEATPAESTCYRLAKIDRKCFPDIKTQGTKFAPYYTNSCHLPVDKVENIKHLLEHQEDLQIKFTGGTACHIYLGGGISGQKAKKIIKFACENYKLPYISLSPLHSICQEHGYISGNPGKCPYCGKEVESLQRITGYIRKIKNFNPGKKSEFNDRKQLGGFH
jgi:anaerobic ribonucleoside-triphosphate reductase